MPTYRAIESVEEFDRVVEAAATSTSKLVVQFTASWCRRCETLKTELETALPADVPWVVVDIDELSALQERYFITQLPRFHVYKGGKHDVVQSFDATVPNVTRLLDDAVLVLDADF